MSEDGENWAQRLPPPVRYGLIAALLGVCLFAIGQRFYGSALGQRMLGIASCPAFAPDIELMLENRNRRYVEFMRRGLGNAAVRNVSTDVDLTNVRLLHKNPISDELTCSVVASSYNANTNTVNETEVRYAIAKRADGGSGYHLRIIEEGE